MGIDRSLHDENTVERNDRDKMTLDYLIAILGFGLCRAWIVFCIAAPLHHQSAYAFNWLYLVSGALVALFIAFAISSLKESTERFRRSLYISSGACLILSACIIPFALSQSIELLLFTGFIVGGIGAGILQVLWGERFAMFKIRFATLASPAAAIVTALVVAFAPSEMNLVGYVVLPLSSFALLLVMADRSGMKVGSLFETHNWFLLEADNALIAKKTSHFSEEHSAEKVEDIKAKEERKSFGIEVGKLMFSIMLFSFLCRVFDAVPLGEQDPFWFMGGSSLFSLVVVGVAFLLFAFILKNKFNPTLTYRLSLPIMVAGFVAIALFVDTHAAISVLLINVGYEFFDILAWILFVEISRKKDENPLRIFGLGVAFMFIGMSIGYLGGELLNTLIANGEVQITVIAMLSILTLVIVGFLVIPENTIEHLAHAIRSDKKDNGSSESDPKFNANEGRLEHNCAGVAESFHLTPRESEVLVLLAYGRTLLIIARDLHIAKGTARTHIENIYRKLDVHKQQELIDLVENYEPK